MTTPPLTFGAFGPPDTTPTLFTEVVTVQLIKVDPVTINVFRKSRPAIHQTAQITSNWTVLTNSKTKTPKKILAKFPVQRQTAQLIILQAKLYESLHFIVMFVDEERTKQGYKLRRPPLADLSGSINVEAFEKNLDKVRHLKSGHVIRDMSLKVYAFFNVQKDEQQHLYLVNQRSYFYVITNQQSQKLRSHAVSLSLLLPSELYQATPSPQTAPKKTTEKIPSPSKSYRNSDQVTTSNIQCHSDSDAEAQDPRPTPPKRRVVTLTDSDSEPDAFSAKPNHTTANRRVPALSDSDLEPDPFRPKSNRTKAPSPQAQ
ncbi:hypothetical protein RvY_03254 [Ramazzottius varieornatus]|uniref:Uncharacterized protein n=1 Tax=Ramazzottius varieornatus TaxID=947166 RepID=A0A1D1UMD8_RAMVA|nr:hypothetical protein RvY_03254 [Ramazzottius varieornatus]